MELTSAKPVVLGAASCDENSGAQQPASCDRVPEVQQQQPANSTKLVVAALTSLVAVEDGPGKEVHHDRILSCHFLLSMFALDSLSWATGKIFQYEALLLAEELGWCYLLISLVTTTAEIVVEFLASALTPRIHAYVEGKQISSRSLSRLAAKAYAWSNLVALLVYPVLGTLIYLAGLKDAAMVCILVLVRTLQYSLCNQVGDQALEMSRPYWLRSFRGTWLRLPGRCLGCCGLRREASPESVSYFVTFLRFFIMFAMGSVYVAVQKSNILRWALAVLCLLLNAVTSLVLLLQLPVLSRGIVDAEEPQGLESEGLSEVAPLGVRPLSTLAPAERSYLLFVVITFGVPPQALDALQGVLLVELPTLMQGALVGLASLLVLVSLGLKICSLPERAPPEGMPHAPKVAQDSHRWQRFWVGWLLPLIGVVALLSAGVSLAVWVGGSAIFAAMVIFLPIGPLDKFIHARVDTFLLCYDAVKGSDLVFWQNVLQVLVNLPLLAANWLAIEAAGCQGTEDQAELEAASSVILVGLVILGLMCLYFLALEPFCQSSSCLQQLVDSALGPTGPRAAE